MTQPPAAADQAIHRIDWLARRELADAYERGWDECMDLARETLRGATDVTSALVRLEVLATSHRVGPTRRRDDMT